ncbi:MAG: filamentous hemagglutinin N-terminal domain-containing protein, partial [Parvularculaceae bacterium]
MKNSLYLSIAAMALLVAADAQAGPSGGVVSAGSATIGAMGQTTTINQSTDKAIIEWQSFNVDPNERVTFTQPTADAIALNRVLGSGPSMIDGQINANGRIFIINDDGVVFGSKAKVDVNGLLATSIDINDAAFLADNFVFDQPGSTSAAIINNGAINAADAGMVAFVAPNVQNSGLIAARFGKIALSAGEAFTLDFFGDSLIAFAANNSSGSKTGGVIVDGVVDAEAGVILLAATTARDFVDTIINVEADLVARSATQKGGKIILTGGDQSVITVNADLDAVGTSGGEISVEGGEIVVTSNANLLTDAKTGLADGGDISVHSTTRTDFAGNASSAPGASGGTGGDITISSDGVLGFTGTAFAGDPPRNGNISLNGATIPGGGT